MNTTKYLIVDDDPAIRNFVERSLKQAGATQLFFGKSGAEALELAGREHPDLIILDVQMTGGNGLNALRQLKEGATTSNIPVLMITGELDFHPVFDDPHASALLQKPFTQRQLMEQVTRLLHSREALHAPEPVVTAA